jgi:hypothetical protein
MMTYTRALFFGTAIVLFGLGCKGITSTLETTVDNVPKSEMITVKATAVSNDVLGRPVLATFLALIPKSSTVQLVAFITSGGLFTENGTKTITVRAVPYSGDTTKLVAQATVRDTIAETTTVRATNAEVYDTASVNFPGKTP